MEAVIFIIKTSVMASACILAVAVYCLCVAGKDADERIEEMDKDLMFTECARKMKQLCDEVPDEACETKDCRYHEKCSKIYGAVPAEWEV